MIKPRVIPKLERDARINHPAGFDMNKPVYYIHVRDHADNKGKKTVVSHGGATIAYIVDGPNVLWAMSKCHVKDVYCRRDGRDKAKGRLLSKRYANMMIVPHDIYRHELRGRLLEEYYARLEEKIPDAAMRLY